MAGGFKAVLSIQGAAGGYSEVYFLKATSYTDALTACKILAYGRSVFFALGVKLTRARVVEIQPKPTGKVKLFQTCRLQYPLGPHASTLNPLNPKDVQAKEDAHNTAIMMQFNDGIGHNATRLYRSVRDIDCDGETVAFPELWTRVPLDPTIDLTVAGPYNHTQAAGQFWAQVIDKTVAGKLDSNRNIVANAMNDCTVIDCRSRRTGRAPLQSAGRRPRNTVR